MIFPLRVFGTLEDGTAVSEVQTAFDELKKSIKKKQF